MLNIMYSNSFFDNFYIKIMLAIFGTVFYWVFDMFNNINITFLSIYQEQIFILVFLMIVDYVSWVFSAWANWEINSSKWIIWIFKKILMVFVLYLCYMADRWMWINWYLVSPFVFFLISNELISILENFDKVGLLPHWIKKFLEKKIISKLKK